VRQWLIVIGFCLGSAGWVGCGQSAVSAPKPPPSVDAESRAYPIKRQRELPRLIAPPPAYGNKIVMAHGESTTSVN